MIDQIREFDRKKHTISLGSCTPILIPDFVSLLSGLYEGMTISTELTGDPDLSDRLKENKYQIVILNEKPDEKEFYSVPVESEHLFVCLPPVHPLADADGSLSERPGRSDVPALFPDRILGCALPREMPSARFLVQQEMDVLGELVANSALPAFTTDYIMNRMESSRTELPIPIQDKEANVTYYCTCLLSERAKFKAVFSAF